MEHETLTNAILTVLIFFIAFGVNVALILGVQELENRKRKKK